MCHVQSMIADRASQADLDTLRQLLAQKANRDDLDLLAESSHGSMLPRNSVLHGRDAGGNGHNDAGAPMAAERRLQTSLSSLASKHDLGTLTQQVRAVLLLLPVGKNWVGSSRG